MKPVEVTIFSTAFSLRAGLNALGAGESLPPNLYLSSAATQAAWFASTEWMASAALRIGSCLTYGPAPAYADTPTGSTAAADVRTVFWSFSRLEKSNFGDLTAALPRACLRALTCAASWP